ncbi:MAG TPA: sigma-70 family RNA polymerase sigma factor [Thermoanaerobaculaceae bacterium]|nr:sigma-70 family RNA polymerase sigma factor [Thermoanaerobaculaceae bacterium]
MATPIEDTEAPVSSVEPPAHAGDITRMLGAARGGDREARDRLFAAVYGELRRLASRQRWRGGSPVTLNTTALVHEAYLKLAGSSGWRSNDRMHFFALAAKAMRQILVDHARHRRRDKRGGGAIHLDLEGVDIPVERQAEEVLAIDQALEQLARVDPDLARLVEWRFFAGLTLEEIAVNTGVSERTLKRDWRTAKAFLHERLRPRGEE